MQCVVAPHSRDCLNPPPHQYDGPHVHRDAPTISCTAAEAEARSESDNRSSSRMTWSPKSWKTFYSQMIANFWYTQYGL